MSQRTELICIFNKIAVPDTIPWCPLTTGTPSPIRDTDRVTFDLFSVV